MNPRPLVSVLIASHNREFEIEARESIARQEGIARADVQVLVNDYPDWYGNKINDLARIARGKYLCIHPVDDVLESPFLARLVEVAERKQSDGAYADPFAFGDVQQPWPLPDFTKENLRLRCVPWMGGAIWTAEFFERLQGYDPNIEWCDYDFAIRAMDAIEQARQEPTERVVHIRELLWCARQHKAAGGRLQNQTRAALELRRKHLQFFGVGRDVPWPPTQPQPLAAIGT